MKKWKKILSVLVIFAVCTSFTTSGVAEYSHHVDHEVHISYADGQLQR